MVCKRCKILSDDLFCEDCQQLLSIDHELKLAWVNEHLVKTTPTRLCKTCKEPIPPERLRAVPDTLYCLICQIRHGDVFRFKARSSIISVSGPVVHIARDRKTWVELASVGDDFEKELLNEEDLESNISEE